MDNSNSNETQRKDFVTTWPWSNDEQHDGENEPLLSTHSSVPQGFHPEKSLQMISSTSENKLGFRNLFPESFFSSQHNVDEYSSYVGNESNVHLPLLHPPQLASPKSSMRMESAINSVDLVNSLYADESSEEECKIIAFVNCKSGGQRGRDVMEVLKQLLGSDSVFNLAEDGGPEKGFQRFCNYSDLRALICGGDGTFSWVAGALQFLSVSPRIAPVPLGTGNDLSRSLGWGAQYPGRARLSSIIESVKKAYFCNLDVWHVKISVNGTLPDLTYHRDMLNSLPKEMFCEEVEMRFNEERWRNPEKFKGQQLNVFLHVWHGLEGFFSCHKSVKDCIRSFQVDGKEIPISGALESIIILNIPNYAAGGLPYKLKKATKKMLPLKEKKFSEAAVDDGLLEIVGLRNLAHVIRIRLGAGAVKLAQGRHVRIELVNACRPLAFQVDGEPWRQNCGVVEISPGKQQPVLLGPRHQIASRKHAQFTAGIRQCFV
ncbi:Diacylglycerol kinase theta [Galdieria sulphuraria]|nr:Diacylglycerol kinase theta [Galdieria sulphuraria]